VRAPPCRHPGAGSRSGRDGNDRVTAPAGLKVVLVISAHADDATLWCGGQIITWAREGWHVVLVRATTDENASVGLSRETTIRVNQEEFRRAAALLGATLGFRDGLLTDSDRIPLREQLIHLYRKYRPYTTLSFDPYSMLYENNQDHLTVARAADEAFWMAMCDKYVVSDLEAGLDLHGVFERWYFGRRLPEVTDWIDIGDVMDAKIEAATAQATMMRDTLHQLELMSRTAGISIPGFPAAHDGDVRPLVELLLKSGDAPAGVRHGCAFAEEFRTVRFAALSGSQVDLLKGQQTARSGE